MSDPNDTSGIWLKVRNVRLTTKNGVQVQVEGDHNDHEPIWWPVDENVLDGGVANVYKTIQDTLDKKRVVLGYLESMGKTGKSPLHCGRIRLQFADPRSL